nr:sialate O-acetylesterase [uncultured Sphingomonas sp.]
MLRCPRLSLTAALLLGAADGADGAPRLDPQFSSHAVIQHGRPYSVTGSADPGERIEVRVNSQSKVTQADRAGRWAAAMPAVAPRERVRIEARGAGGSLVVAEDVLGGDVWLCSGQSNMEYPLSRALNGAAEVEGAADPLLRLLTVPQRPLLRPAPIEPSVSWQVSVPATAAEFSAACQFMARHFRARDRTLPIGLIDATWGGTAIRSWMDAAAARASGGGKDADLLALYLRDQGAGLRAFGEQWGAWWRSRSGDRVGTEPWRASDRLTWQPLPSFTYWENWGQPAFAAFNGGVWARKRLQLSAEEASRPATLSLGVIDDADSTFVNGVLVGSTYSWSADRNYALPPGVLRAGVNEIMVFVRDNWSNGGFQGPADKIRLAWGQQRERALGEGWEISVAPERIGEPVPAPWDGQSGLGTLYNGMIAPLGALPLRGVAWYQGEADVGRAGYDRRLAAIMAGWRRQFGQADLPFLVVGLAGWGKPRSAPAESGWAALIDEQRKAAEADRNTALISAIDLGDWTDIHPANKQEVGRRLALAAHAVAYKVSSGRVGPAVLGAARDGATVRLRFSKPLQVLGSAQPAGFQLCASGGACRFVTADVQGDEVVIGGVRATDQRVRYAWADYPIVNLYDADLLPVPVFELPIG